MKMSRCFISVMVQENIFSVNFPETAFVKIISMLSHTHPHTHTELPKLKFEVLMLLKAILRSYISCQDSNRKSGSKEWTI